MVAGDGGSVNTGGGGGGGRGWLLILVVVEDRAQFIDVLLLRLMNIVNRTLRKPPRVPLSLR